MHKEHFCTTETPQKITEISRKYHGKSRKITENHGKSRKITEGFFQANHGNSRIPARKCRKARDRPQPRVIKEGANMAHNDLEVRPTKIGAQSVASPIGQTGPTRIVRQRPMVVGRPLHYQGLVPKAAVQTAVPKWSSRQDRRKCTKRPPSNRVGKPSKRKVGRRRRQFHRRKSDKHQNGS